MEGPLIPLYMEWIDCLLKGDLPIETESTCDECAMCPKEESNSKSISFSPDMKCCSYFPKMPNYLIGGLLLSQDSMHKPAQVRIQDWIECGRATPLGIMATAEYDLLYQYHDFGMNQEMKCPHYQSESGGCGIWDYRPSTCQTWYCKFTRGATSMNFWRLLNTMLNLVEVALSRWCLLQLDIISTKQDATVPVKGSAGMVLQFDWDHWQERKHEFYYECYSMVSKLSWEQVADISGAELKLMAAGARLCFQQMKENCLPKAIQVSSFSMESLSAEQVSLVSYSTYDPMILPRKTFDLLNYFDGRDFAAIQAEILEAEDLKIPSELVQLLLDFGVLEDANCPKKQKGLSV